MNNLVRLITDHHKLVERTIMEILKTTTVEATASLFLLQKGSTPRSTRTLTHRAKRMKASFDATPMFKLFEAHTEDFAKDTAELEAKIDDDTFNGPVTRNYVDAKQTEQKRMCQRCYLALFKAARDAINKAEKSTKSSGVTKENFRALWAAMVVVSRAKAQDSELETLRQDLEKKVTHEFLAELRGSIQISAYEKTVVDKCRDYGRELTRRLREVDGGAVADTLETKELILQKYTGDTNNQELFDSVLAWGRAIPT